MSFGFGSNQNTGSTFGGFGGSNNTSTGFGANANPTSTGGSLFGGNTATSGGSAFGGFGANNQQQNNPFAANKPTFGAPATTTTSGGGMFGSNTSTSGGFGGGGTAGGFGSTANSGSTFGGNTGGGLFGQNKPATGGFGASNSGGTAFGGGGGGGFGSNTSTTGSNPFGSNTAANTSTGFGASQNTGSTFGAFGGGAATSTATNNNNGTASTPFNAVQEKEQNSTTMQAFQSITFQDPYKNKSFEELRVEDYAQGRRYGGSNGQAGAFGQSTPFGGFGQQPATTSAGGGMFGQQNNTATSGTTFGGFGANANNNTNTAGAFGSNTNTGGGMFGQNKPATGGGIFGSSNTTSSAPASNPFGGSTSGSGGGLFGGGNAGGSGFGASANTANTGGGLFGNTQNNQQQPSNPFGSSTPNTGGGLFGSQQNKPAGGGLFGGGTSTNTGGGLFGNNNNQQQQQQSTPFGQSANTGAGLFGNQQNQQKPAFGGFGQSTNTGGAFGSNTNSGGGIFGGQNNQSSTGGGLFGNQQNKPAGGSLFGNSTGGNTGGGLFGSQNQQPQQQQNAGGGLFGSSANTGGGGLFGNQQNKPAGGLFGSTGTSNAGGGLFGASQQNQTQGNGGSLFGGNQSQQGGSLFGGNNSQQQNQQPNQLHASLTAAPYGNEQLFASLAASSSAPVGPLATPLNGAKPAPRKTPSLMASMRLNSPVYTPRGGSLGRTGGYGFSYSTYGTPGSAYSASLTPGASSMLKPTGSFGSALSGRLSKSMSMSNLRGEPGTPTEGRSLLRESALSPPGTGGRYGSGNIRKLNIDKSLRTELFPPRDAPEQPKKSVRYDETPHEIKPTDENALVPTDSQETEQDESPHYLRNPPQPKTAPRNPEMAQVNGSNGPLDSVPEDSVPGRQRPGSAPATQQKPGAKATSANKAANYGEYWTQPSLRELDHMSRGQRQKLGRFTVGRHGFGRVEFGPCDLSTTTLEDICGKIVRFEPRKATVYEDNANKPPMGQALNVPSTIFLEQSWARSHGGMKAVDPTRDRKAYEKHVTRLKRVGGTKFINYDAENGIWQFSVDHFTTYGLDDDDEDEEDFTEQAETSGLSEAPADTPEQTPGPADGEDTMESIETGTGEMDDTFQFKLDRRSQLSVPGGFEETGVSYDYDDPSADEAMDEERGETETLDPFRSSGGAVQAPSPGTMERYNSSMMEQDEPTGDVDMAGEDESSPEMPGSFLPEPKMLRSILKPSTAANAFASPQKLATESWEEQLQRTISPRKRDRQALKDMQQSLMKAKEPEHVMDSPFKQSLLGRSTLGQSALGQSYLAQKSAKKGKTSGSTLAVGGEDLGKSQAFRTSMDIMSGLWADEKSGRKAGGKGFEYPYSKKPRLSAVDNLSEDDAAFHQSLKPSWSADGTLVYASAGSAPQVSGELAPSKLAIVGEHRDVRFANFVPAEGLLSSTMEIQMKGTAAVNEKNEAPHAYTDDELLFRDMATQAQGETSTPPTALQSQEVAIWQLSSVLFDPLDVACPDFIKQVPNFERENYMSRLRLDAFVAFWSMHVAASVEEGLKRAKSAEEKALLLLTKNDVTGACEVLVGAKDFRLASLVAQLPGSKTSRQVMKSQIEAWQKRKDWSEMSQAIRGLYSILAGEVCVVSGQGGAAEDKAGEFSIADTFRLTWQQSLALRVLYGGHAFLDEAIRAYCADLDGGREVFAPAPLWEQQGDAGRKFQDQEDTTMSLCRLFASGTDGVDVADLCEPLTVSGSSMNSRVAWQLASIMSAKGIASLPAAKAAQLTLDFAGQLETAGQLTKAVWVLLHVQNNAERQGSISALLQRNAGKITDPAMSGKGNFEVLTQDWQIPRSMVFVAKSMYAKAEGDLYAQARWLLFADQLEEAHEVLCGFVGPQAVIEQDYAALSRLLQEFPKPVAGGFWEHGGQVYDQFARLTRMPLNQKHGGEGEKTVKSLREALRTMEGTVNGRTLEQRVAIIEMKKTIEEVAREHGETEEHGRETKKMDAASFGAGAAMLDTYRKAMGVVV